MARAELGLETSNMRGSGCSWWQERLWEGLDIGCGGEGGGLGKEDDLNYETVIDRDLVMRCRIHDGDFEVGN